MYLVVGSTFYLDKKIAQNLNNKDQETTIYYMKWFYISRLTNNVKIFIPFMTFLLRVNDPFIKKLINQFLLRKNKDESTLLNDSQLSDNEIFDDDFVINN